MTHAIRYLEANGTEVFDSNITAEIQASYFQLMEEHVHIEVWDKNAILLNTFLGYDSLLLHDVANGSMRHSLDIYDKIERDGPHKKLVCTLTFKMVFEEIWDFLLKFLDWRTSNLENEHDDKKQSINPRIDVKLDHKQAIVKSI